MREPAPQLSVRGASTSNLAANQVIEPGAQVEL
jgi:hypothetical protein